MSLLQDWRRITSCEKDVALKNSNAARVVRYGVFIRVFIWNRMYIINIAGKFLYSKFLNKML